MWYSVGMLDSLLCLVCGLVFASDQQTIKTSSQDHPDQPIRSSQNVTSRPSGDYLVEVNLTGSPQHSEGNSHYNICSVLTNSPVGSEAFYHTLESPVVTVARQSLQLPISEFV